MSGTEYIVGGVVSTISTCWVADAEFPLLSIAVQIIVDEPNGNNVGALLTNSWIPFSSIAIAFPRSTDVKLPVASITRSAGGDIIGLVLSGIAAIASASAASAAASASAASASAVASASDAASASAA